MGGRAWRYLGTAAHLVINFALLLTDPNRANHQSTFMLACIRDVGGGKLRIVYTYVPMVRKGHPATDQETGSTSTASGSDVKEKIFDPRPQ